MASFAVFYCLTDEQEHSLKVDASSFPEALQAARRQLPLAQVKLLRMLEDNASVTLRCGHCTAIVSLDVKWSEERFAIVPCPSCSKQLRLHRERRVAAQPKVQVAEEAVPQVLGSPPRETPDHGRWPSKLDLVRAKVQSPYMITWRCRGCHYDITCEWHERQDIQVCPDCHTKQYVPSMAYAWQSRIIRSRQAKIDAERAAREQVIERERAARTQAERSKREAAAAAQRESDRLARVELSTLSDIAVKSGIVTSHEAFANLGHDDMQYLKQMSRLCDDLKEDLIAAMKDNVMAEKGVAYGRPAAAGASIVSALAGYGWAGLAFGALAAGARVISSDWKRAKAAEYQAKWGGIFADFDADDRRVFTSIFAYKYPTLAGNVSHVLGQLGT